MFSQPMSHTASIDVIANEAVLELKGKGYE